MLRLIAYLLISVVLITILRMVIGVVTKAAAAFFTTPKPAGSSAATSGVRAGGELKRDPVCGTFIPVENAITKTTGGEVVYFCSKACRDKHRPA